jgi:methylglyoxal synthase
MKMCDVHGVPLGTNVASAEILLRSPSQATYWGRDAAATHT